MAKIGFSLSNQMLTACAIASAALITGCSSVDNTSTKQLSAIQTAKPQPQQTAAYAAPATANGASASAYAKQKTALTPAQQAAAQLGAMTAPQTAPATQTASVPATAETAVAATAYADAPPVDLAAAAAATSFVVPGNPGIPTARPDIPQTAVAAVEAEASPVQMASAVPQQKAAAQETTAAVQPVAYSASPQIPQGMYAIAAMELDFDTGEPMGLENLVARQMIVPMPRPGENADFASAKTEPAAAVTALSGNITSSRPELDKLISYYAKLNGLPEALVHRVVKRESTYNPRAYHNGNYGLMQIRYNTAKGLGYEGPPEGLFDAETNLKYATKYLRGAFIVADNQHDGAVKLYASGYYYTAKRKGLLDDLNMQ